MVSHSYLTVLQIQMQRKVCEAFVNCACGTAPGTAYNHENITPAIVYGGGNTWAASLQKMKFLNMQWTCKGYDRSSSSVRKNVL